MLLVIALGAQLLASSPCPDGAQHVPGDEAGPSPLLEQEWRRRLWLPSDGPPDADEAVAKARFEAYCRLRVSVHPDLGGQKVIVPDRALLSRLAADHRNPVEDFLRRLTDWLNSLGTFQTGARGGSGDGLVARVLLALALVAPPLPRSLVAVVIQFAVVFFAFVWARGARLGPPRSLVEARHRSTLEYLESFAAMTQRAGVERALLEDSWRSLRRTLHERTGIPLAADDVDAAALLAQVRAISETELFGLARDVRTALDAPTLSRRDYVRLVRRIAEVERLARG